MRNTNLTCLALAAVLALSACGAVSTDADGAPEEPSASSATPSAVPSATGGPTPQPTPTPAAATPSAATPSPSAALPSASAAATPGSVTAPPVGPSLMDPATSLFTTSDGLYSFVMPADWTATPVPPNDAPDYGVPLSRTAYSIQDAAGAELALFEGGIPGDGAAVPHPGHVMLDSEELPALSSQVSQGPTGITFVFDHYPDYETGGLEYNARLHQGVLPADGTYTQFFQLISVGTNGQVSFTATFDETRFPDPADAAAWLETEEYAALRAMLCSFTVNG